jgi:hypothetical protein
MTDGADTEMDDRSAEPVVAAQFLSEFEVSLPPLGGDLEASFSRLADLIGAPETPLSIVIHIADESEPRARDSRGRKRLQGHRRSARVA